MNDDDIASKFMATIRFLFVFRQIIVLIICIQLSSQEPLFGTALVFMYMHYSGDCLLWKHGKVREYKYSDVQCYLLEFRCWLHDYTDDGLE